MKTTVIAIALALAVSTLNTRAQDAGGPPPAGGAPGKVRPGGGPGPEGPGGPHGGFHLLPPRAVEHLKLTDEQKKQLEELEADVKAKIGKILTPEQLEQLKQMRPPMRQGPGGSGGRGPGRGGPDGDGPGAGAPGSTEGQSKPQRPPSE